MKTLTYLLLRRTGDALMRALCGEDVLDRVIAEHRAAHEGPPTHHT